MEEYTLQYKPKLSKKQAKEKICAHAMFGKHEKFRPKSVKEVQTYFLQKGHNTNLLVEKCRDPKSYIPEFENIIGPIWHTTGGVTLVDKRDNEEIHEIKEPGQFFWTTYEAHLKAACDARDRAVEKDSYLDFQECLSQGFASIDAFLNTQARSWNKQYPKDKLIDSPRQKVSLETKIDEWIPKMSGGKKIKKDDKVWNDFKTLKRLRDESAIHPKLPGYGVLYKDLAKYINAFRFGVAFFLGNLHLLVGNSVPAIIINAVYMPNVEVIKVLKK